MYIIKNALHNLVRNRGRNLMIGGIIFVIIVSVVTALMINNTASGVIEDYKTRFGSEVSIVPNMGRVNAQTSGNTSSSRRPVIPAEQLLAFADSDYLLNSVLTAQGRGNSDALNAVDEDKGSGGGPSISGGDVDDKTKPRQYKFKLFANQYSDFTDGYRELTEGSKYPENPNECLISQELLELNGLSIGDTIHIASDIQEPDNGPGTPIVYHDIAYTLTIAGTYDDLTEEYSTGMQENAYNNRRNEIFMSFDDLAGEVQDGLMGITIDAKYYLKNPDMLGAFTDELYAKGLSSVFDVTTDEGSYNAVVGPVEGLKGISVTFVIIVLAFGAIILALLSSIAIRERKYEIGVLRAMGMNKLRVIFGLWAETLTITILCLIIGLGVGLVVSQPVTNVLLEQQVAAAEKANNPGNGLPPGAAIGTGAPSLSNAPGRVTAEPLKNLDVSLDIKTLLEIVGIALLLSSLAGIIATRKITKYEPIKILMERN